MIKLAWGRTDAPKLGCTDPERCFFEWYNWLTQGIHSDSCPFDVSPILHSFGMNLNDLLPDEKRQELVRFLPNGVDRLVGTAHDGKDETRAYLALDWLIRTYIPLDWLIRTYIPKFLSDLNPLPSEVLTLRSLPRIEGIPTAQLVLPIFHKISYIKSINPWAYNAVEAAIARQSPVSIAQHVIAAIYTTDLALTTLLLQDSAINLFDQLITGTWP